jgi:hypothetical protein
MNDHIARSGISRKVRQTAKALTHIVLFVPSLKLCLVGFGLFVEVSLANARGENK